MAASPRLSADRARSVVHSREFIRFVKYASSSVITTVGSLGLFYCFYLAVRVDNGSAAVANILATAIMTVPSYYLNRSWAWGKSGKSHLWREVVPFWVIAFASLVLSTGAVWLTAHNVHRITSSHEVKAILVGAANFCTYAVLWIAKFILFNKVLFKQPRSPSPRDPDTGGFPVTVVAS